jgi:hypothetical protein
MPRARFALENRFFGPSGFPADPSMSRARFALENRFFGPSGFPADYAPLAV